MAQIKELMTENPATCPPSATITDVAKVMAGEDVGPVPIVESDRLVGFVTDRDIVVRAVAEGRDPSSTTIGEIMTSDVTTVTPDTDVEEALETMGGLQVRRLPVVEGDRLVGIVAQADLARQLQEAKVGDVVEDISR